MKKTFELDFRGKKLIVEHGELAKQAHGAVLVRYGDTVILSTAVVSKSANILSSISTIPCQNAHLKLDKNQITMIDAVIIVEALYRKCLNFSHKCAIKFLT